MRKTKEFLKTSLKTFAKVTCYNRISERKREREGGREGRKKVVGGERDMGIEFELA